MQTGENAEGLRKIADLMRLGSIFLLLVHLYANCFELFKSAGFTNSIINRIVYRMVTQLPFLTTSFLQKFSALVLLTISLIGVRGKKDENLKLRPLITWILAGVLVYFLSSAIQRFPVFYIIALSASFAAVLAAGSKVSRVLLQPLHSDPFNEDNETFPQEERLLQNAYSINLPAQYNLKGIIRQSWINVINPFRALLVMGTPGSGKSYFVIRHVIAQHLAKGFTGFIYDFKFPDLSRIAYNHLLKSADSYPVRPKMYFINFDDLSRTHRCNVLYPASLLDITDATESSRTIMLALNREWIKKSGDFFVESPINFTTAIFWYLKKYKEGKYCTLPHAIELAQVPYDKLFPVLGMQPEIEVLINPFVSAYLNKAMEQLEGQIASAKIGLARLASPSLYYVLSGNDFTLDINNPEAPKIVCAGNNPAKQQIYGAVLSLYIERMLKLVNRKGQQKSTLIFDEFPTVYVGNIDNLIATARSNLVATTLGIQDMSQLRKDYGKEQADVILNVCGNIISGQVIGDTAKQLSDRVGKIMQERNSISINTSETSISKSLQLDAAIPAAKIACLSSGQFVGAVADDPTERIKLKAFHCEIINDHTAIAAEEKAYQEIPEIRQIGQEEVMENFSAIKKDIKDLVESEIEMIKNHPDLKQMLAAMKPGDKKSKAAKSF